MVLEHFINLDRNLFAAEYSILTWRFISSSSSKYWFARIPKYLTLLHKHKTSKNDVKQKLVLVYFFSALSLRPPFLSVASLNQRFIARSASELEDFCSFLITSAIIKTNLLGEVYGK